MPDNEKEFEIAGGVADKEVEGSDEQSDTPPLRMKLYRIIIFGVFLLAIVTLLALKIDEDLSILESVIAIIFLCLLALGLNALIDHIVAKQWFRKKKLTDGRETAPLIAKPQINRMQPNNDIRTMLFVLPPCLFLCFLIALGVAMSNDSPLSGWIRTSDKKVAAENESWHGTWPEDLGDAPVLLCELNKRDYPIFMIRKYRCFDNSLQTGLNDIPTLYGFTIVPEGGLPSTDGRNEAQDYIERVNAWWESFDKVQENYVYKDNEGTEIVKQTCIIDMPKAQVEDLANGSSAARILVTVKVIHEDGKEQVSFNDTLLIFGQGEFIEIAILGTDYDKHNSEEERIVDRIKAGYPYLELSD